jgi:hypothetical protein
MTNVCVNFIYQLIFCLNQNDILYVIDILFGAFLSLFTQYLILNFNEYWCFTRNNSSSVIKLFSRQN